MPQENMSQFVDMSSDSTASESQQKLQSSDADISEIGGNAKKWLIQLYTKAASVNLADVNPSNRGEVMKELKKIDLFATDAQDIIDNIKYVKR